MSKGIKGIRVALLFGGQSVEHNISVLSAAGVADALQKAGYECIFICIDKQGYWHLMPSVVSPDVPNPSSPSNSSNSSSPSNSSNSSSPSNSSNSSSSSNSPSPSPSTDLPNTSTAKENISLGRISIVPGGGKANGLQLDAKSIPVDMVFPILHGIYGEDGKIQGALDSCAIPYIGGGVTASAITNDKDITKRLLSQAGIDTAKHITIRSDEYPQINTHKGQVYPSTYQSTYPSTYPSTYTSTYTSTYKRAVAELSTPFWVKPANLGSSLGIQRVATAADFASAVSEAFNLDSKVILEEHIQGREMECSVLEDASGITVSLPGEIIVTGKHYFYDYDAKYNDPQGAKLEVPAKCSAEVVDKIKQIAIKTFKILECRNIMRLDIFLADSKSEANRIIVNEVQTIPGFTAISMYPKLLAHAGIPLVEIVERLVSSVQHRG